MYFSIPLKFIKTCFRSQKIVLLGECSMWTRKKKKCILYLFCELQSLCDNYVQLVDGVVKIFYSFIHFCLLTSLVSERCIFKFPPIIVVLSVFSFQIPSVSIARELCGKQGLLLTNPGGYIACMGPHNKVESRDRLWTRGSAFTGVEGEGSRVFRVHSLMEDLKPKSRS